MNFKIHNKFKLSIKGDNKRHISYFKEYFSYFMTNENVQPDIDVIIGSRIPWPSGKFYIVDDKYYIDENCIACKDRYKIVKWNLCIEDINDKPKIYFNGSLFSELFLREYILEPLIAIKLSQQHCFLLHASSFSFNGKGFILAANKGVGKTSTLLNIVEDGGIYLSNEPSMLSDDGIVYSFPTPIHFYYYNKTVQRFFKKLNFRKKMELELKHLAYLASFKYASLGLRILPQEIFTKIGDKCPAHSLIIINKINGNKINISEDIDKECAAKKLRIINQFEMEYLSKLFSILSYIYPDKFTYNIWDRWEQDLIKALSLVKCHEIEIPQIYNYETYMKIKEFLDSF